MSRFIPRALCLVASLALAALALAACGGDSKRAEEQTSTSHGQAQAPHQPKGGKGAPAAPVSAEVKDPERRAYITRADRICRRFDRERGDARERAAGAADVGEAEKAYGDTITIGEKQLREIRSIPVPRGDEQLLRANVFAPLRRQLAVRRQMRRALAADDTAALKPLRARFDQLTLALAGFARGYGYRVCGED